MRSYSQLVLYHIFILRRLVWAIPLLSSRQLEISAVCALALIRARQTAQCRRGRSEGEALAHLEHAAERKRSACVIRKRRAMGNGKRGLHRVEVGASKIDGSGVTSRSLKRYIDDSSASLTLHRSSRQIHRAARQAGAFSNSHYR